MLDEAVGVEQQDVAGRQLGGGILIVRLVYGAQQQAGGAGQLGDGSRSCVQRTVMTGLGPHDGGGRGIVADDHRRGGSRDRLGGVQQTVEVGQQLRGLGGGGDGERGERVA